jgi:HK97 family phage portal protein
MGMLGTLRSSIKASGAASDERFWSSYAGTTGAGVTVNADTAMKTSAVYACVRLISETLASLPLILYQRLPNGGKDRALNHPLYDLLHDEPCQQPRLTAFQWKSTCMVHLLLRGNAYCRIVAGPRGPVDQLRLIHPDRVETRINGDVVTYRVRRDDGTQETLNAEDVFHMTGLSLDGVTGVSLITYARETIGLSLAAESYAGRVFSQDGTPRGVLQLKGRLSQDGIDRLRAEWAEKHAGLANAHKPAVLEEGAEWKSIGMTAEDAQMLASRQFQVVDVARWFNVPLHMIQETTKATSWGSGIEHMSLGFLVYTLLPWLRRWEDTIAQQLIIAPQRYFAEFLVDALLRGNTIDRYGAYAIGRQWGWLSVNDILSMENRNPVDGGDGRLQPLNMVPLGTVPTPSSPPAETAHEMTLAYSPPTSSAVDQPPPLANGAAHLSDAELLKELVNGRQH